MNRVAGWLVGLWVLGVVAATLYPYDVVAMPGTIVPRPEILQYGRGQRDPVDFVLNVLLFVPLGALLHDFGQRRSLSLGFILVLAGAAGLLMSVAIECLQGLLPGRDSSAIDVLANTGGSLVGALAFSCGARIQASVVRRPPSRAIIAGLTVVFAILALFTSAVLQARTRLSNWSVDYPLLVGNEKTGDRPWRGRVVAFELSDAATPEASLRRFAAGGSLLVAGTRIAAFDLRGGPPYSDRTGNLPSLNWTERPNEPGIGGVSLQGRPWLRTVEPASSLAERIGQTNAFTLRVLCAPDDTNQDGPARIISNSQDPLFRNFTIGQRGVDMVVRIRTPATGLNGLQPEVEVPGVFSNDELRDVVVTYDGATLRATAAGLNRVHRTTLGPGASLALAVTSVHESLELRANELQFWQAMYVALLFVPAGVLVSVLGRTRRGRLVLGLLWVVMFTLLLESTLVLTSGRSFEWGNVGLTALVGVVILPLVWLTLSTADVRQREPVQEPFGATGAHLGHGWS